MSFRVSLEDPLLTEVQLLAFGCNARGRVEVEPLHTQLMSRHPAAFARFSRQCRAGNIAGGTLWIWRESRPYLGFLVIRDSPVGPARVRYAQQAALTLARDYRLEGLTSIALAAVCTALEAPPIQEAFALWLAASTLDVRWHAPAG